MPNAWVIGYTFQWLVIFGLLFIFYRVLKLLGDYMNRVEFLEKYMRSGIASLKKVPSITVESKTTPEIIEVKDGMSESILLVFISPTCAACKRLIEQIGQQPFSKEILVVFVTPQESAIMNNEYINLLQGLQIPLVAAQELFDELAIPSVPFSILLDSERNIISYRSVPDLKFLHEFIREHHLSA